MICEFCLNDNNDALTHINCEDANFNGAFDGVDKFWSIRRLKVDNDDMRLLIESQENMLKSKDNEIDRLLSIIDNIRGLSDSIPARAHTNPLPRKRRL